MAVTKGNRIQAYIPAKMLMIFFDAILVSFLILDLEVWVWSTKHVQLNKICVIVGG
jgi:hypothetical protein